MAKGKSDDPDIYIRRKFEDVRMPEVTYGQCKRPSCKAWSDLADGLCMRCWDRSNETRQRQNRSYYKNKKQKQESQNGHSDPGTISG